MLCVYGLCMAFKYYHNIFEYTLILIQHQCWLGTFEQEIMILEQVEHWEVQEITLYCSIDNQEKTTLMPKHDILIF